MARTVTSPLALSPTARPTIAHFGSEAQPLVEVEQALADPQLVVEIAARHHFRQHGAFYPGLRAPVSETIAMPLVMPMMGLLQDTFALARRPRYHECYLSIVTDAPGALAPIQRLPHFDGTEPERLAVLLYLDRAERGGTGFYRQRATGYESVDAARFAPYRATLEAEVAESGLPPATYIDGDTPSFVQTHVIAGRFNSLVVYRGNTLHCACLPAGFVPDPDPRSGRLTLNLFLS